MERRGIHPSLLRLIRPSPSCACGASRYRTILVPVVAHGSYDFLCIAFGELGLILALMILVAVYVYIRHCLLQLQRAYPEEGNVREKIAKGEVVPMSAMSLTCIILAALASLVGIVMVQVLIASTLVAG